MNNSDKENAISRREFLGLSALGLASLTILPSWKIDGVKIAPSDRVVLGFIGLGQQGLSDFGAFSECPGVQVAACCDVDTLKTERFRRRVAKWQASKGMNERCDKYEFYEDLEVKVTPERRNFFDQLIIGKRLKKESWIIKILEIYIYIAVLLIVGRLIGRYVLGM